MKKEMPVGHGSNGLSNRVLATLWGYSSGNTSILTQAKNPTYSSGSTLGLPTHYITSNVFNYSFCCIYLVQTTLCGMNNATPLCVKWAMPFALHLEWTMPFSLRLKWIMLLPLHVEWTMSLPLHVEWLIVTCLESITTVGTLLLWVFVPPE